MNSPTIPAYLPATLRAGDTWKWTREGPSDYPATSWTLMYQLQGPEKIIVTATADGVNFTVTITAATTKLYHPGVYRWFSYVEQTSNPSERYQLESGSTEVLPDLATVAAGFDARTHAQRTVDLIESAIEQLATDAVTEVDIAGRHYTKMDLAALHKMRLLYKREVEDEAAGNRINQGLQGRRKILMRMVNP